MTRDRLSRRQVLKAASAGTAGLLAGCQSVTDIFPNADPPGTGPQSEASAVTGRVVGTDGETVPGLTVTALAPGAETLASTTTGNDGRFTLRVRRPVWIRVAGDGYRDRVRACEPGVDHRIVVTPSADTATLAFAGDTMFARRFYTAPTDQLNPRARIRPGNRREDHRQILAPTKPALTAANLTSVNLETPLTQRSLRHPEKLYAFASHPTAADALADAGVDYAALGNNHAFDALDPGLTDTVDALDSAGIAHSGAGMSADEAWTPAIQTAGDLEVALLSCTTITGSQYSVDWTANGPTDRPVTTTVDGESLTVPAGTGVAGGTDNRLQRAVRAAQQTADVVVVQIHGGEPYQRAPTDEVRQLTRTAALAGADLVVNHHPHVVGGLERIAGALVAWSLGNFVFDQRLWVTFPTYLMTATVTPERVSRVTLDPLLLDGFTPYGIVGKPNRAVTRTVQAHSETAVTATRSGAALGDATRNPTTTTVEFEEPGRIYHSKHGWVSSVENGRIRLGQDLLPTGTFESTDIDADGSDGSLWRYGRSYPTVADGHGIEDSGGVELRRIDGNSTRAVISNGRRIPVSGQLTVAAAYRTSAERLALEVAWYAGTSSSAIGRDDTALKATAGAWRQFTQDLTPPADATHASVVFALAPPDQGTIFASLDDIRLLEWAGSDVTAGQEFDHVRPVTGATVTTQAPAFIEKPAWRRLSDYTSG